MITSRIQAYRHAPLIPFRRPHISVCIKFLWRHILFIYNHLSSWDVLSFLNWAYQKLPMYRPNVRVMRKIEKCKKGSWCRHFPFCCWKQTIRDNELTSITTANHEKTLIERNITTKLPILAMWHVRKCIFYTDYRLAFKPSIRLLSMSNLIISPACKA